MKTDKAQKIPTPEQALAAYRPLIEGYGRAVPMALLGFTEGTSAVSLDELADHPQDALSLLSAKFDTSKVERPVWVVFTAEALKQVFPDGIPEGMQRGDLQRRAQGGDKAVEDVIVGHCVSRAGGLEWTVTQTFRRREALGTVEWHEVVDENTDVVSRDGLTLMLLGQIVGTEALDG
jgi:hypothetical protein